MVRDFWNGFFMTYNRLSIDEKKRFFKIMIEEMEKNIGNNDFISNLTNEISSIREEIKNTKNLDKAKNLENFLEIFQEETKEILGDFSNKINQEKENFKDFMKEVFQEKKGGKVVLPISWTDFENRIFKFENKLFNEHKKELEKIGLTKQVKVFENDLQVFSRENLISEKKLNELKNDYIHHYLEALGKELNLKIDFIGINQKDELILSLDKKLTQEQFLSLISQSDFLPQKINLEWNLEIKQIKKEIENSMEFTKEFEEEIQEILINKNNREEIQKNIQNKEFQKIESNQSNQEFFDDSSKQPWIDFLSDIKKKNFNLSMSKNNFMQEFYNYCQNKMNDEELKVLIILMQKNPSRLNFEHKTMIKEGIKIGLENQKILNEDLKFTAKFLIMDKKNNIEVSRIKNYLDSLEENQINQKMTTSINFVLNKQNTKQRI